MGSKDAILIRRSLSGRTRSDMRTLHLVHRAYADSLSCQWSELNNRVLLLDNNIVTNFWWKSSQVAVNEPMSVALVVCVYKRKNTQHDCIFVRLLLEYCYAILEPKL